MKPIIVWDSLARFSDLPGHWLLPVGVAVLWIVAVFVISNEARKGAVLLWQERQDRRKDRLTAALRIAQDERRLLRLVTRTGSRS